MEKRLINLAETKGSLRLREHQDDLVAIDKNPELGNQNGKIDTPEEFAALQLMQRNFDEGTQAALDNFEYVDDPAKSPWLKGGDPYASRIFIKNGKRKGEPVAAGSGRHGRALNDADRVRLESAGYDSSKWHLFANLQHDGKWYIAAIPKGSVKRWIRQETSKVDGKVPAHSQYLFDLEPGALKLFAQPLGAGTPEPVGELDDLIWTLEGVGTKEYSYSFVNGIGGEFPYAMRLMSMHQMRTENMDVGIQVHQRHLNVGPEDRERGLAVTLRRAMEAEEGVVYYSFTEQCTLESFDIIDEARGTPWYQRSHWAGLPFMAKAYLWMRGMLGKSEKIETLMPTNRSEDQP